MWVLHHFFKIYINIITWSMIIIISIIILFIVILITTRNVTSIWPCLSFGLSVERLVGLSLILIVAPIIIIENRIEKYYRFFVIYVYAMKASYFWTIHEKSLVLVPYGLIDCRELIACYSTLNYRAAGCMSIGESSKLTFFRYIIIILFIQMIIHFLLGNYLNTYLAELL